MEMHNPAHPGLVLQEFIGDMSITEFAKHLGITRVTLSRIINGRQGITAEMSLRLSRALGTHDELWLKMQMQYDLWQAKNRTDIDYNAIMPLVKATRQAVYA